MMIPNPINVEGNQTAGPFVNITEQFALIDLAKVKNYKDQLKAMNNC